jgi:hypothetical protein
MGGMRNAHEVLVGKTEGRKLHGRPVCRREDDIRMDLK